MKMKHIYLFLFPILLCILFAGCSQARIDAKDAASYEASLKTMRQSLSDAKRKQLDEALDKIFTEERKRAKELGSTMGDYGIMLTLDEMTADEIIRKSHTENKKKKLDSGK